MVEVQERRMLSTLLNHSLRCLKHPLDRGKKIRRLGDVMRKCRKVFKGKQQRKSRIVRKMHKVDRSTERRHVQQRERRKNKGLKIRIPL